MADYGLKCWNSAGALTLDLTSILSRLRYSTAIAAEETDSVVLPDIDGKSTVQFAVSLEDNKVPATVTRSGTTITWTARSGGSFYSSSAIVLVFIYD